jgi:hypothetical protein
MLPLNVAPGPIVTASGDLPDHVRGNRPTDHDDVHRGSEIESPVDLEDPGVVGASRQDEVGRDQDVGIPAIRAWRKREAADQARR